MEPASELEITPLFPARLPKGTELAGHVVDGWLRDGGMAAIYRARRASDGARMALKLQLPSTTRSAEICQRFDREAEAMRRVVGEPHIVELHAAGVLDDGRRYFVMEWVEGDNLEELLDSLRNDDKRLSVTDVCELGLDLAKGLAALHDHDLVHRDIKPSNVMVGRELSGELIVKLVDFGIVADLRAEPRSARASEHADEAVMGTSAYMAPEQVAGRPPTPAVDVFALGVVLYEALTGSCVPPDGWTPETLRPIDSLRRNVPLELVALVRACMSSDAEQRPATGMVVVSRLEEIFARLQAAGDRKVSSEEVPIRTGGTVVAPRAQLSALEEPVRTGGTEVALTHEQVLTISSSMPRLTAVAAVAEAVSVASVQEVEPSQGGAPLTVTAPSTDASPSSASTSSSRLPAAPLQANVGPSSSPPSPAAPLQANVRPSSSPQAAASSRMAVQTPVLASSPAPVSSRLTVRAPAIAPSPAPSRSPAPTARPERAPASLLTSSSASIVPPLRDVAADAETLEGKRPTRRWVLVIVVLVLIGAGVLWIVQRPTEGDDGSTDGPPTIAAASDPAVKPDPPALQAAAKPDSLVLSGEPVEPLAPSQADSPVRADAKTPRESGEPGEPNDPVESPTDEPSAANAPESTVKARPKGPDKAACDKRRSDAMAAKMRRDWVGVLTTTSAAACWTGATQKLERRRLRVEAYAETGNFARCVKEGGSSPDSQIGARVKWCTKKLGS